MRMLSLCNLAVALAVLVSGAYAKSTGAAFSLAHSVFAGVACAGALVALIRPRQSSRWGAGVALGLLVLAGLSGVWRQGAHELVPVLHAVSGIVAIGVLGAVAWPPSAEVRRVGNFRMVARVLLIATLTQVTLGALVRHLGAGLSIPDFPLAMGRLVPPLTSKFVVIHFLHRVVGMIVVTVGLIASGIASMELEDVAKLGLLTRCCAALLSGQVVLGAYVIWWQRDVWVTTAHVVNGAVIFALATTIWKRSE